jgi:protein-tyrosine kinase
MGRIDDALRRAGTPTPDSHGRGAVGGDVFVSPWAARDDIDRGNLPGEAPVRVVDPLRIDDVRPGFRERLTIAASADPLLVHQFHRLAAILLQTQRTSALKSVMIASAVPREGKTLTSLNLALVLSGAYRRRVLLVEADLRRPTIASAMNIPTGEGLSDVLKGAEERKAPLVQLTDTLMFLPAGRPDPDPLSGLTSPRMQHLLRDATERFDWVIVDTPPLGSTSDATLLCPLIDAAILVIRARETSHAAIQAAIETLGHGRILGVVLNGVDHEIAAGYDTQYAAYSTP